MGVYIRLRRLRAYGTKKNLWEYLATGIVSPCDELGCLHHISEFFFQISFVRIQTDPLSAFVFQFSDFVSPYLEVHKFHRVHKVHKIHKVHKVHRIHKVFKLFRVFRVQVTNPYHLITPLPHDCLVQSTSNDVMRIEMSYLTLCELLSKFAQYIE